jgi:hypothetical protein
MHFRRILVFTAVLVCGGLSLHAARAEYPPTNPYWGRTPPNPTVSPYLNLSVDTNGLSNYSSLVRPMLAQRELLAEQAADKQLQSRTRIAQGRGPGNATAVDARRGRVSGTFMNYSHYFGGNR